MTRIAAVALAMIAAAWLSPAFASAAAVETRVVSTVDGSQVVRQLLGQVRAVELGADAATVTMETDGVTRPVSVSLAGEDAGGSRDANDLEGLATVMAFPFAAGSLVRLLRSLSKLGGM